MENLGLQYAEIVITLVLLVTNIRKNRIGSHESNIYLNVVFFAFAGACLDLGSVYLIRFRKEIPEMVVYFVCNAYLVSLMLLVASGFLYLMAASQRTGFQKITRVTMGAVLLASLVVFFEPLHLHDDPVYSYGPAVNVTFVISDFCILLMLVVLYINRRRISKRRIVFTSVWIILWIVAAVIEYFNRDILLLGFFSAIGILIMFIELENPASYIDKDTGLYNTYTLAAIENQWRRERIRFIRTDIFLQADRWNVSAERIDEAVIQVADALKKSKCRNVFHSTGRLFSMLSRNEKHIEDAIKAAKAVVEELDYSESGIRVQIIMLKNSLLAASGAEIDMLFNYYETYAGEEIFTIDEHAILAVKEEDEIIEEIKSALHEGRVEVFYQPIWSVQDKMFRSAEALVRIRSVMGEIIPPGRFIPVAEKSGLIYLIGQVVLEKTCEMIANDGVTDMGIRYIEVNLSVEQCEDPELNKKIMKTMQRYHIKPEQLNLEITESAEVQNRQILSKNMALLSDNGIAFSLDDFGTGQSNLDYIISMPVDIVKFDMTIIRAYFKQERAKWIVNNITRMVHEMGMHVVCEGVEEKWQLDALMEMGADYIQGYYFSKPLPKEEFLEYIKKANVRQK